MPKIQQSMAGDLNDFLKTRLTMNTVQQSANQAVGGLLGNVSSINLRGLKAND